MPNSIHFPKYAFETVKGYDSDKKEQLLYQIFAYWFDGVEPDLAGWDQSVFALIVADLQERAQLIQKGGAEMECFLDACG